MSTSTAYQYATAPGGIGLDQMNQNIINFFAGNPDETAARAAMQQYGVSEEDIRRATGKALGDYYPSGGLSALPADTKPQGGLSNLPSATSTAPAADASLTPSGTGNVEPVGSEAQRSALAPGGIGLEAMNQNILNYLATSPTEVAALAEAKKYGVSREDIERATGKSYTDIFPEVFKPGNVLTSGFSNIAEQLGGSGYYKGVAVPTFYDKSLGDAGYETAADQLAKWKAGIDKADLSTNAPFGFVETPVYAQPTGDYDSYISGYQQTPATALDYLINNNPTIKQAVLPHTSTFTGTYKVVNGKLKEVGASEITPEDLASGNAFFMLGGATGGLNRERMAQLYRAQGDELIPVGDPKMYKGAVKQDTGLQFLDMAASALAWVPGPWQIPAQIYVATRGAMEGDFSGVVKAIAPPVVSAAYDVYRAVDSGNYIGALMSVVGQTDIGKQLGGVDLGGGFKVADAITAANVVDRINSGDYAGALRGVGSLTGSAEVSTAGSALQLARALESGNPQAIMTAGQGLINNVNNLTAKSDVANLLINSKDIGAIDADAGGITSPFTKLQPPGSPTEDEQIAQQQRVLNANQALADYVGPGNDLSREGLVSQLQRLGFSAADSENYAKQADQQLNQQRVAADVMGRYSQVDPEFGTPGVDRQTALTEMMAAGLTESAANNLLNSVDAQNAIKLENKLSVQSAYRDFLSGTGTEEQLRSALTSAGYNDKAINDLVVKGRGVIEGQKITAGESAQERAANLPDIRAEIAGKPTFNEAYATARDKLGANAIFTWQGKDYSTATAQERPDLTGATKPTTADLGTPYVAPNGMHNRAAFIQAGGGTSDSDYAKYVNAVNALVAEGKSGTLIKPSSVNSEGNELPSTKGAVTMATPRVDSFLGSVAAQGVSSFGANSIGGVLNALGFTDAGRAVMDKANMIASAATAAEGADVTKGKADINSAISKVGDSTSLKDLATNIGNLASTVYNNPKAFGATVGSEVVEEVLQLATLKGLPGGFWVKETVASAIENGGAAYNQEFESQLAKGAKPEVAHANAQKAAGVAAGTTVALAGAASGVSKLAGALTRSADDVATGALTTGKEVGKTLVKESAQEAVEEGSIAAGVDMALRGSIDAKNMLTAMTGGALYGGPTSSTMQATGADKLDPAAISSNVSVQIEDAASKGISLTDATNSAISSSMNAALESGQSITAIGPAVITGALDSGADLSSVINSAITVGINTGTDPSITTGTIVSSAVVAGLDQGADSTVVIGGAVTSSIDAATKAASDVNATATSSVATSIATATKSGVDVNAATTAAVDAATKAGVDVNVNTATEGGVTTTTAVSGNTTTAVAVDTNNGTTTTITNSGNTTTQIVSDQNNTVTTTVNTNTATVTETDTTTNITTTTKISQNTQTVTTVDPTTATKTETKTDLTTGQSTTVTTDLNTNTSTTTNTSTEGEDTIPGGQDTIPGGEDTIPGGDVVIPSGSPVVTTDITPPPITTTPEPTKTTKPPPVGPAASGAGFLLGSGMGMPSPEDWLGGKLLSSQTREKYIDPLAQYFAEVQDLPQAPIAPEPIEEQMRLPYYTYGQEPSLDEIFGGTDTGEEDEPMYQAGGQVMNPQFMYAKGGLSREDFREGKHVSGPGDGQSDDIPAMLADGEFVFPADVVAALGNGSTKAGTEKLYEMMHAIRARARSNKPKDLPPPALKSPLDYLKKR